ncbi:hypothetical protein ACE3MZ_13100 [Paenibacillus sp. WLX1005]|uniref:hypothetical protein n=1 Tax=Paenibacillus sp. WLX1005 TaxID=3243766 RepID=UPI0039842905
MRKQNIRMMTLTTDEQLYSAARSGIEVTIYIEEEDYTGKILEYSDGTIKTAEGFYILQNCVVKTRENYFSAL